MYPKSKCLLEFVPTLVFGKHKPDTALADGDWRSVNKLLRDTTMAYNSVARIKCEWPQQQIDAWQSNADKIDAKTIPFNLGKIMDCGFNDFQNYLPYRKNAGALMMQPDQYGHLIIAGGGTPSSNSRGMQKQQDKCPFRKRNGLEVKYGKKKQLSGKTARPYNAQWAQLVWKKKAQYKCNE